MVQRARPSRRAKHKKSKNTGIQALETDPSEVFGRHN